MARKLEVCICGGGHVAHALVAAIGANSDVAVKVFTRRPEIWDTQIHAVHGGLVIIGHPQLVTADPSVAVAGADIIFIAAPAFAHDAILTAVGPFVAPGAWIGALPAPGFFDWAASSSLAPQTRIFGAQRSPYNCRVTIAGRQVEVLGVVPRLAVAASPRRHIAELVALLSATLSLPIDELDNFLCVTLAPSPTIFHPARLFALLSDWDGRSAFGGQPPLFYEDWDDTASRIYLRCDDELQAICRSLPLDMSGVTPARSHYGAPTAASLTGRIRSLAGLRAIPLPIRSGECGWMPDLRDRFFLEDFPFGLRAVRTIAALANVETPTLDMIDTWSQRPPIALPSRSPDCSDRVRGRSLEEIVRKAAL